MLVVLVVAILLKLSIPYVMQSYIIGEKSPDPGGLPHRWILKAMIPLGFALLLIRASPRCCARSIPILDPCRAGQTAPRSTV